MNYHYTADPHFGHLGIISKCNRPFIDTVQMNRELIRRWNAQVGVHDTVIINGDFGNPPKLMLIDILKELHGHKILIMGNHDLYRNKSSWINCGMNEVLPEMRKKIGAKQVLITHRPMHPDQIPVGIDVVVCGHIHNTRKAPPNHVCISVELTEYRPISQHELAERLRFVETSYASLR